MLPSLKGKNIVAKKQRHYFTDLFYLDEILVEVKLNNLKIVSYIFSNYLTHHILHILTFFGFRVIMLIGLFVLKRLQSNLSTSQLK